MRILHVVGQAMARGGTETWLMHVLRNIDRDRFRMDFLVEAEAEAPYDEEVKSLGSRLLRISSRRRLNHYGRDFKRILEDNGPYDIVHSHLYHYNGYILRLSRQAGVPARISHSHNDYSVEDHRRGRVWGAYGSLMRHWIHAHATAGLAASPMAAASLYGKDWRKDPRWQVLYCGLDMNPFKMDVDPYSVRRELGFEKDDFVLGHVGRFLEQKNHAFLVDIARQTLKREPKTRLLLIGAGPLKAAIERKVFEAGLSERTLFAGVRPDVPRLLLGAVDAFVFPSFHEGLGLAGVEAQAAGVPLFVSDVVPPEISVVAPLVRTLSLSEPASVWAEEILSAKNRKPPVPRKEALAVVEGSHFNIEYSVKELREVYGG